MKPLLVFLMMVFPWGAVSAATTAARPNIIMVFIDDMGWGDFSCFGNKEASTPHVDRLAAEGYGEFLAQVEG